VHVVNCILTLNKNEIETIAQAKNFVFCVAVQYSRESLKIKASPQDGKTKKSLQHQACIALFPLPFSCQRL
jgi:hypothetical protein